ncbi:hypothetical protein DRO02_03970 [archaeon]|nr:MAG: hypothetical protein DRO02_03970 [archaeon]RLG64822.1 MAG: hypothetical protein DRN89_02345 [archaeon]RLG65163.1 MAG: hypothetical protein DRO21_02570 [archaeon]HDM23344.1 NUDIX domain-containing protein [Candidatus Bathyarchaeota archaeon]
MVREYPSHPIVGVAAIVLYKGKVLLVKRAKPPAKGLWSPPGGLPEAGEPLEAAVKREIREETGIEIDVKMPIAIVDVNLKDENGAVKYHYVIMEFLASPLDTKLSSSSDAIEAKWFDINDLGNVRITRSFKLLMENVVNPFLRGEFCNVRAIKNFRYRAVDGYCTLSIYPLNIMPSDKTSF